MFLKEIENRPSEGMMKIAFRKIEEGGHAVPEIMHLFRFKRGNRHLIRFTEEVMRGPSPLSPGFRELIGAFVSRRNQCSFCSCAHAPVAAELLGNQVVDQVLTDFETANLAHKEKELLRYLAKITENPASTCAADIERLKDCGWTEEAIYDALTVASLFKFYNTWNNGSGVKNMTASDYAGSGRRLLTMGYCMDFGVKMILRVLWVGRSEIHLRDWLSLAAIPFASIFRAAKRLIEKAGLSATEAPLSDEVLPVRLPANDLPSQMLTETEKSF